MRVLLVSPNREHLPDPVFPLGLAYISSALKIYGYQVRVLDLCFSDDTEKDIRHAAFDFRPEIIGVSLRNIDDVAYPKKHSYLQEYKDTIALLRKYSDAPVVLGGSGFTIMPEAFMKDLKADYGVVGEGEYAFPELLEKIKNKQSPTTIHKTKMRIRQANWLSPDRELFDYGSYYRLGGMLNIQTKRGCPFKCIYCTYPKIEGCRVRMRDPVSVADEIGHIIEKTGARHFFIVDSIFNYPASHAQAVCDEIIKRRLDIQWSCYANPAYMTDHLAESMAKSGCTGIEFGTDSLVDEGLSIMGKGFTFKKVKKASDLCRKAGIKFCHFIFVGSPGDDEERVKINLERLDEIKPDAAIVMAGIRVFPNTVLADMAKKDLGISDVGLEPAFYLSKKLRDIEVIAESISKRKHWVMPGFEINMHTRLQRKLREYGIKGSLWEELSKR